MKTVALTLKTGVNESRCRSRKTGVIVLFCFFRTLLSAADTLGPPINDRVAGEKLARELRAMQPGQNLDLNGSLKLSTTNSPDRTIPIKTRAVVGDKEWRSIYETVDRVEPNQRLVILHIVNQRPVYENKSGAAEPVHLTGDQATNSFAGSDFALLDLGLEFFHWPVQSIIAKEMRKGRGCQVLESRPEKTNLYSRVVSWIDEESKGLLMAQAYDAKGKLLKVFEVKRVNKEDGQLREAEIRNRQTKSSTRLQFDSSKE